MAMQAIVVDHLEAMEAFSVAMVPVVMEDGEAAGVGQLSLSRLPLFPSLKLMVVTLSEDMVGHFEKIFMHQSLNPVVLKPTFN